MNILIAPDSFKNCLSAREVATALKDGIEKQMIDNDYQLMPMADGGEGTVDAIVDATRGSRVQYEVKGPLGRKHTALFGVHGDGKTAIIEMASASGIELLKDNERNPWITTTYGTGQLIKAAIDHGCTHIIIGIGGSATNDAGMGMAKALGVRFLDAFGKDIGEGGGELGKLDRIDLTNIDPRLKDIRVQVACDVTNPLTGPKGASVIYGPQKGANRQMVEELDKNLNNFARVVKRDLGREISHIPGAGAAGGLGAGLMAFTNAKLGGGFDIVSEATHLPRFVEWANVVVTGEGKIDNQTQYGKTPMGVATIARKFKKPVIAIAGTLGEGYTELYSIGFDSILSIIDQPMELHKALKNAPDLIRNLGEAIGGMLKFSNFR